MLNVFLKTLRDKRAFMIGWSLGLMFLAFIMVIVYPSFTDNNLDALLESLPEAMRGLVGDLGALKEISTYLGSQLFDIRIPILIGILSIILALSLSVAEEERGQMRTLVALPTSRTRIVLGKWLAAVVICTVASLATLIGVWLSVLSIGETIEFETLLRLIALMLLMVVALVTLIFGIGIATGNRALTMTIAVVLVVGSFLISTFSMAVDWIKDFAFLSIFYYYPAVDIAKNIVTPENIWVYVSIILVSLIAAILIFRRRDVKSN